MPRHACTAQSPVMASPLPPRLYCCSSGVVVYQCCCRTFPHYRPIFQHSLLGSVLQRRMCFILQPRSISAWLIHFLKSLILTARDALGLTSHLSSLLGCEPVLSPPYMNSRGLGENLFMLNLTVLKAQYTNKTVMRIAGLILKSTKFGFSISNCQILITVLLVYCV